MRRNLEQNVPAPALENTQLAKDTNFVRGVMYFTNQIDFYQKQEMLANIFYNNVGLVREDMGLKAVLGSDPSDAKRAAVYGSEGQV